MKYLILVIILILRLSDSLAQSTENCDSFLKEINDLEISLNSIDTGAKIVKKNEINNVYVVTIKRLNENSMNINLLKNKYTKELIEYILDNDILVIKKGSGSIMIVRKLASGNLSVRTFPRLCD